MHFKTKKSLSQNFLLDNTVIHRIVDSILKDSDPGNIFVEIGPGLGALTLAILPRVKKLYAIEKDERAIAILQDHCQPFQDKLELIAYDALNFKYSDLTYLGKINLFGNLPYNISSQLLIMFTKYTDSITDIHVMLQKEVAQRLIAQPSTKNYSRLSVMIQKDFVCEILFDVPPEAFNPKPSVVSSFVSLKPVVPKPKIHNKDIFAKIVLTAFQQRRKTLKNSLAHFIAMYPNLPCNFHARAEDLSVEDYIRISNYIDIII